MIRIKHCSVALALHQLADGDGTSLLLLHDLGSSSAAWPLADLLWPGPIYALDFTGHGESERLNGGAYTPELFCADADHVLGRLGEAAIAGAGLGAYVALLVSGARPDLVISTMLLPGTGLAGGGAVPREERAIIPIASGDGGERMNGADPTAAVVDQLVRPPEYSRAMAAEAHHIVLVEDSDPRPPWWEDLHTLPNVKRHAGDLRSGLEVLLSRL